MVSDERERRKCLRESGGELGDGRRGEPENGTESNLEVYTLNSVVEERD